MKNKYILLLVFSFILTISGCRSGKNIMVPENPEGRWDDDDAIAVAISLVEEVLNQPWVVSFENRFQRVPVLIVADVQDETAGDVDAEYFMQRIERKLLNSGNVRVVRGSEFRDFLGEETGDPYPVVTADMIVQRKREMGVDYMFSGKINSQQRRQHIRYDVRLQLTNLHNGETVWTGNRILRKRVPGI
jgi:PBP1b-binding outer membrane lipoprotein LpoB